MNKWTQIYTKSIVWKIQGLESFELCFQEGYIVFLLVTNQVNFLSQAI